MTAALQFLVLIIVISGHGLMIQWNVEQESKQIITAISDNGCSKQTQIELSQTKSNADVYNYAALSTSYKGEYAR